MQHCISPKKTIPQGEVLTAVVQRLSWSVLDQITLSYDNWHKQLQIKTREASARRRGMA
jgi:hypothetical protein